MIEVNLSPSADRYAINGHRVILYAGTFESYQGLDLLVDASPEVVKARRDVRFVCAGGNEKQIDTVKLRVSQRRVADYFIFPGLLPPEEIESLLKIAHVLVSPRIAGTNTPLKIYSYLRSGVPIVATKIISHTQVLTNDVALLVEPRGEALGAGILKLLDDADLSRKLAQNARRLAEESYSAEAYHRKVAEVFTFLAARSQGRRL